MLEATKHLQFGPGKSPANLPVVVAEGEEFAVVAVPAVVGIVFCVCGEVVAEALVDVGRSEGDVVAFEEDDAVVV